MLVEGPAEQYFIPPLVRNVMKIDLDEEGIAVIPIYGTHFHSYARLFGPNGIQRKCALVADGDLKSSDASDAGADDDVSIDTVAPVDLTGLANEYVKIFQSLTTLEPELTLKGNLAMFASAADELGAPRLGQALRAGTKDKGANMSELGQRVLRTAKRFGKARFAQVASRYASEASEVPKYISDAVMWLVGDKHHGA
jgi:putative ATP-dependent endonuclease of OLD family